MNAIKKATGILSVVAFIAFVLAPLNQLFNKVSSGEAFLNVLTAEIVVAVVVAALVVVCLWAFD